MSSQKIRRGLPPLLMGALLLVADLTPARAEVVLQGANTPQSRLTVTSGRREALISFTPSAYSTYSGRVRRRAAWWFLSRKV